MTSQDSANSPDASAAQDTLAQDTVSPEDKQTLPQSRRTPLLIGIGIGVIGCAAAALSAAWLTQASPVTPIEAAPADIPTETAQAEPQAEAPTPAETEAESRAAWEAQQAHINSVLQSMDRATLIGGSPTKGNTDASVVLIKFSDFQCPYCAVASADMKTFMDGHESDVLYVYKHFPLDSIHPEAIPSAKAAWAAGQQGQFWLFHNGLFAYQDRLGDALYTELAEKIELDLEQFNRDRNSNEATAALDQDRDLALQLNLRGTPTFLMNNIMIPAGAPLELFDELAARINTADAQ